MKARWERSRTVRAGLVGSVENGRDRWMMAGMCDISHEEHTVEELSSFPNWEVFRAHRASALSVAAAARVRLPTDSPQNQPRPSLLAARAMSLSELLEAASLAHLSVVLGSHTLESLIKLFSEQGRTTFIRSLKEQGVEKLSDRQRLATAIAKAAKDGVAASAPKRGSMSRWVNMELAKELAAFDIDESQLMKDV